MALHLVIDKEKRKILIEEIKRYVKTEHNQEIGDLAAGFLLDFFIERIGPEFYNQGVFDSYTYMNDVILDLLALQK